jgi:hypothetical protein
MRQLRAAGATLAAARTGIGPGATGLLDGYDATIHWPTPRRSRGTIRRCVYPIAHWSPPASGGASSGGGYQPSDLILY